MIIGTSATPKERKKGSGGRRPGAGRKPLKKVRFGLSLYADEIKALGGISEARRIAIEHLVKISRFIL